MANRLAWLAGALGVAGAAAYRIVRRKPRAEEPDPAEELRRRLEESRSIVEEREQFEEAETTVDRAEPETGVDERRRAVHERGRSAIDDMRTEK